MPERRPLTEGLKPEPPLDPKVAREFIYQKKGRAATAPLANENLSAALPAAPPVRSSWNSRVSLTVRIRGDLFHALKRASFERQLQGIEPNTLQDIVDEALEPWLRKHKYLS
jgi:hypothetical protein